MKYLFYSGSAKRISRILNYLRRSTFFSYFRLSRESALLFGVFVTALALWLFVKPATEKVLPLPFALPKVETTTPASAQLTDFDLLIPKIGVTAPIISDVNGKNQKEYLEALKRGVAHFKDTAKPTDKEGNMFIFGHSTDWSWNNGQFKTIFKRLPELETGDEVIVHYKSTNYTYVVFQKKVAASDDLQWLLPSNEKILTLMTCYPIGSNKNRIIIQAKAK